MGTSPHPIPSSTSASASPAGPGLWGCKGAEPDQVVTVTQTGDTRTVTVRPQRFRLRGIDCPELGTQDALGQVGFIVLTTHKTDNYGRYLADVRYRPGEPDPEVVRQRGRYLNRELLERRLARRYVR